MTQQNISRMAEAWRIISRKQTTQADRDNATRMALHVTADVKMTH